MVSGGLHSALERTCYSVTHGIPASPAANRLRALRAPLADINARKASKAFQILHFLDTGCRESMHKGYSIYSILFVSMLDQFKKTHDQKALKQQK